MYNSKDRKYKYTEEGLVRMAGTGRRKANPHKFCMCGNCKKIGSRTSRKRMFIHEVRRNNKRLRKGLDVVPIGYTD